MTFTREGGLDMQNGFGVLIILLLAVGLLTTCDNDRPKYKCLEWTKEWDGFTNSGATCDRWE